MDFAMGPNQGQGVPANPGDDGIMVDLRLSESSIDINGTFNDTLPGWGSGKLQAALTAVVTKNETSSASAPSLPNDLPASRTQVTLSAKSIQVITDKVGSDGHLDMSFASQHRRGNPTPRILVYTSMSTMLIIRRNPPPCWAHRRPPRISFKTAP